MKYLIVLLLLIYGCSSLTTFNCADKPNHIFIGKSTPLYYYILESNDVGDMTVAFPESDTVPIETDVIKCATYKGDYYYIYQYNSLFYMILKELAFSNKSDAIEYARSLSNKDYIPKYSNSVLNTIYTGPRGGKYHLSPSGKKIYEKSGKKSGDSRKK